MEEKQKCVDCDKQIDEGVICDDCLKEAKAYHPRDCKHLIIEKNNLVRELSEHLQIHSWVNTLKENEIYLKGFITKLMYVLKCEEGQLEAWEKNPVDLEVLTRQRNKLNRKISTLKKVSLQTA